MAIGKSKFWLVWSSFNLHLPTTVYIDEGEAIREAKKLSEKNPGTEVYVMKSTHYVFTQDGINKAKTI